MAKLTQEIVDRVFSHSELGFQEFWTAEYLAGILHREGFDVQMGAAGMPTAYVATWGRGDPVIGFMGDFDGLPETSQRPGVPYRDPIIPSGPGHGEGHNTTPGVDITAPIAVKRVMQRHGLQGTLKVIPGVAEELVASRTYMVMAGLFTDMDVMLSTHVGSRLATGYGISGSGLVSTMFTFHGTSAHGGNQPNVVPSEAAVWYYFRELDHPRIKELHELGQTMAAAAAMMTSTTVEERALGSACPSTISRPLAERMHANIERVGMPEWSEADMALAKAAQRMMGSEEDGLETEIDTLRESSQGMGGGSDDIAEASWNVPTVRLSYPANIPGMTYHHWSAGIAAATPIAHKGSNRGAQVIAMTAVDVLLDPDLVAEAWRYHREVQTKEYQWVSLIPEGIAPPINLNAEKMKLYRPELEKLIYDPSKYDTYLEQLGVPYPPPAEPPTEPERDPNP